MSDLLLGEGRKSPIELPEATSGDFRIEHHDGIHKLVGKETGIWMTDYPIEVKQMYEAVVAVNASGIGLVGGLGLGVVAEFLGERDSVKSLDIIERSQDVVNLVAKNLIYQEKFNIIVEDINVFLRQLTEWPYDFAILDTWMGSSAETWLVQVLPQRRLIANRFGKQNVHCWVENEMKAELLKLLTTKSPYWILSKMSMPMSNEDALWFMDNVGLPEWEEKYGDKI